MAELPTGTGKTVCIAELLRVVVASGKRGLVIAHRGELLKQAANKLADVGVRSAIEQADQRAGRAPVVVASVQSLRGARLEKLDPDEFGAVIVDECHHSTAAGYRQILERFARVPTAGFTATGDRADGVGLGAIYGSVAYRMALRTAIRDQWLVPIRARRIVVADLDLSQVKAHHGDLDTRELSAVMQREKALHGMVAPLLEQAGVRRTIVFAVDVAHAHAGAEMLNRYRPGCARAIDGSADDDERSTTLAAFARGEFQFLINCALFTEGFDEPSIACVAFWRPTCSRVLHCQMLGRGTRLLGATFDESIANGKRDMLALDFVGNVGRHRLAGPADVLAGAPIPDEMREEVERELERGELQLEEILAHAEQQLEVKREKMRLLTLAHYKAHEIDPFLGPQLPPDPDGAWAKAPATEVQLRALVNAGLAKLPPGLTRGEASRYISAIAERRKRGLCHVKQAKRLTSLGLDTSNMTALRAGQLFAQLRRRGWGPWAVRDEPEYVKGRRK